MANFSLLAKLGLDSKGFQRGLDSAKKKAQGFQKNLGKIFAAGAALGGLTALIRKSIEFGTVLSDATSQLRISAEAFQVFNGAMLDAGGTQKQLEKSLLNMQRAIVQGSEGLTTFIRAFERIGLNIEDLRGMSPEQQFIAISKAIATAEDQAGALTATIEIFGGKSRQLTEVMKRLNEDGFQQMREEVKKTHGVMREETSQALDQIADNMEAFGNKTKVVVGELTVATLSFADIIGRSLKSVVTFLGGLFFSFSAIVDNIVQRFKSVNRVIGNIIVDTLKSVKNFTLSLSDAFQKILMGDFQGAFETVTDAFTESFKNSMTAIDEEGKKLKNSQKKTIDAITDLYSQAKTEIGSEIDGIIKAYKDLIGETTKTPPPPISAPESTLSTDGTIGTGTGTGENGVGTRGNGGKAPEDPFEMARKIASKTLRVGGSELARLATQIAKAQGMRGTRFERFQSLRGQEMFRRFDGGRLSGEFTKQQIAAGIGKQAQAEGEQGQIVSKLDEILTSIEQVKASKLTSE